MPSLLRAVQAADPTSIALIERSRSVTYSELAELVLRTAGGLLAKGISPGANIAVASTTSIDGVVAYLGVQAAGAIPVMVNYRATLPEFEARFAIVDPRLILVSGSGAIALPPGLPVYRPAGASENDIERLDAALPNEIPVGTDTPAAVLFTSGVSGTPRPVPLTHGNLTAAQLGQINQPSSPLGTATIALAALPMAHIYGLNSVLGSLLRSGARIVMMERFDAAHAAELVAEHQINTIAAVPQMWNSFLDVGLPESAFRSVTRATASAAPLSEKISGPFAEYFGVKLAGGYGLTESSGTICLDDPMFPRTGTVGRPLGDTVVRLVDREGDDVEAGDSGEIWLKGSSMCRKYTASGELETPHASGSWYQTGDVGVLDGEGRLCIIDRIKDVVIVGGFNVSPAEIESVLMKHPGVSHAAVIGEADDRSGERIVAFVSPSAPGSATTDDLTAYCRRQLARYKIPARFELRDELPMTESGKILRRLLR
jgi:long-chain acyl-CoA synthetase